MTYGVDVAAYRSDDLDKILLHEVASAQKQVSVLDIGCGSGGMSKKLTALGAEVTAVDIQDYSSDLGEEKNLTFIQANIAELALDKQYDYCLVQRTIHYLQYEQAKSVLGNLKKHCHNLYISATGLESEIGNKYPAREAPLTSRFHSLSDNDAQTFSITAPICLYNQSEFKELLESTGWEASKLWTSAFGNHKAVATSTVENNE